MNPKPLANHLYVDQSILNEFLDKRRVNLKRPPGNTLVDNKTRFTNILFGNEDTDAVYA